MHQQTEPLLAQNEIVNSSLSEDSDDEIDEKTFGESHTVPEASHLRRILRKCPPLLQTLSKHIFSKSVLTSFLPQCLQPGGLRQPPNLPSTAYLDAVRGFAAVAVVNHHFYWYNPILSLPFVSIVRQGRVMVDVFFIISGYVLTRKMLRLMREDKHLDLLQCLASSTFRRYMRLFLSACFGSFICMVLVSLNLVSHPEAHRMDSIFAQFGDWIADTVHFTNPFADVAGYWYSGVVNSRYHYFLWTIPAEFRGSVVVFLFGVACCKMNPITRQTICCLLIASGYTWNAVYVSLFLFGVLLAERGLQRDTKETTLPLRGSGAARFYMSFRMHFISGLAIVLGVYLAGQPKDLGINGPFPWPMLSKVVPFWWPAAVEGREHFWLSISAALILYGLDNCTTYQRPFNWAFSQYIGRLSFGIYVMQLPVALLYKDPFKSLLGDSVWVSLLNYFVHMFILLWVADYFIRIDRRIISIGRWLEKKTFVPG